MANKDLIAKLRKETLAPFSSCIKALEEAKDNFEEAKKLLFKQSILKAKSSSQDSSLPEGKLVATGPLDLSFAIIVHLRAQTDFVTNSQSFVSLQKEIADMLLQNYKQQEQFPATLVDPVELLTLRSAKDNLTVDEKIASVSSITKETIKLGECWVSEKNPNCFTLLYTHYNSRLAALLTLRLGSRKLDDFSIQDRKDLRHLIIHYAGTESLFLTKEDVPKEWIEKESASIKENMLTKNPDLKNVDQIVEKQMPKRIAEVTFSEQAFILNSSVKMSSILERFDLTPIWAKKVVI